jgi:hypothetical protein
MIPTRLATVETSSSKLSKPVMGKKIMQTYKKRHVRTISEWSGWYQIAMAAILVAFFFF